MRERDAFGAAERRPDAAQARRRDGAIAAGELDLRQLEAREVGHHHGSDRERRRRRVLREQRRGELIGDGIAEHPEQRVPGAGLRIRDLAELVAAREGRGAVEDGRGRHGAAPHVEIDVARGRGAEPDAEQLRSRRHGEALRRLEAHHAAPGLGRRLDFPHLGAVAAGRAVEVDAGLRADPVAQHEHVGVEREVGAVARDAVAARVHAGEQRARAQVHQQRPARVAGTRVGLGAGRPERMLEDPAEVRRVRHHACRTPSSAPPRRAASRSRRCSRRRARSRRSCRASPRPGAPPR